MDESNEDTTGTVHAENRDPVVSVPEEGSRWWYWIVAYPIYTLLSIPLVIAAVLLFAPVVIVAGPAEAEPQMIAPVFAFAMVLLMVGVAVYALLGLVLTVLLPIALYLDAKWIADSELSWEPDPVLYGILGILNFVAAPVIGIIVALYYLYRRRQNIGIP
ncbi:hypothetical protein [Natronorarus salvus]|uniref:hypothetical protein n=1 Tax=Natronorarus salvus TaxID=3117733 RepID=UPI002F262577